MNKIKQTDLDKISLFCDRHLLPLELLKSKNNTRFYSSRRKTLAYLLHFINEWSSIKIALILDRNSSTFRLQFPQHEWDLQYDKAYRMRWMELVKLWDNMGISMDLAKNSHNLKPMRIKNIKTGKEHFFRSKSETAKFLKCHSSLIDYYKNRGLDEFLGYKIINN
jgi:hypothetical protein